MSESVFSWVLFSAGKPYGSVVLGLGNSGVPGGASADPVILGLMYCGLETSRNSQSPHTACPDLSAC